MDMISNEILRDLNIKRTFMGVDKVQSYPIDLVKLTVKYELDKSKLQEIDRGTQDDLIQSFLSVVSKIFKKSPNDILLLGFSPEYRIDIEWALPIFYFKFFVVGENLKSKESELRQAFKDHLKSEVGGSMNLSVKTVLDREDLFFELYPNSMLDEVLNRLMNMDENSFFTKELMELFAVPISLKSRNDFIDYYRH